MAELRSLPQAVQEHPEVPDLEEGNPWALWSGGKEPRHPGKGRPDKGEVARCG